MSRARAAEDKAQIDRPAKRVRLSPEAATTTEGERHADEEDAIAIDNLDSVVDEEEEYEFGAVNEPAQASDMYLDTVCPLFICLDHFC